LNGQKVQQMEGLTLWAQTEHEMGDPRDHGFTGPGHELTPP